MLFAASFAIVPGSGWPSPTRCPCCGVLVIAFVVSGVASYFLLNRPREPFAQRVDERARRASAAFEERKAREDAD